jgi:hypothetical protein
MRILFIIFQLTIDSKNIELFCNQLLTYSIILMFFMRSGNHKFYIQFLRLLGLKSFRITLYFKKVKISVGTVGLPIARKKNIDIRTGAL